MPKIISLLFLGVLLLSACAPKDTAPLPISVTQIQPAATTPTSIPTPTQDVGVDVNVTQSAPTPVTSSAIIENDDCGNPYYPVVNGAEWQYTISTGASPLHTMSVNSDKTFTITVKADKSTFTLNGSCTEDGIILLEVPGISSTYSGDSGGSTLTTTNNDGVTLPNDVQIGDDWSQSVGVNANAGEGTFSSQIETSYKAVGNEIVSTPIGPINALKVEETGSLTMGGRAMMEFHGYIWYGQGIGVVKSTLDDTFEATLATYSIPQP